MEYTWEAIKERNGSWHITCNGVVQPFGAIFFNERGDVGRLVKAAVNRLNRGVYVIRGCREDYAVIMGDDGRCTLELR